MRSSEFKEFQNAGCWFRVLSSELTVTENYKHEEFESLYHYSWNEEEAYKLLKNRIELEDFSCKTAPKQET